MKKNILKSLMLIFSITSLHFCEADDVQEENFESVFNQLKCTLSDLAGSFPIKICYAIHQLVHAQGKEKACLNSLLLFGPPGTGKTSIAESVAKMAGAEFHHYSAAQMVTRMQGSGPASIKKMFRKVEKQSGKGHKVVLFVDEIDAFTKSRTEHAGEDMMGALIEFMQQTVKCKNDPRVIIIVATNRKEMLDEALLSRFEKIEIPLPDQDLCGAILKYHLRGYKHNLEPVVQQYGERMHNAHMSGRDIERVVISAMQMSQMVGSDKLLKKALERAIKEMVEIKEKEGKQRIEKEKEEKEQKEIRRMQHGSLQDEEQERLIRRLTRKDERVAQKKRQEAQAQREAAEALAHATQSAKNIRDMFR